MTMEDTVKSLAGGPDGRMGPQEHEPALWIRLWTRWKRFGHRIGDFQARLILTLIYFVVLAPYGVVVRLFGDVLDVRRAERTTMWIRKKKEEPTVENARRQF